MRLAFACIALVVGTALAAEPKLDTHGDPLPEKAVLRLGTVKYRLSNLAGVGFRKSGELVGLTCALDLHTFPADGGPKATVTKLLDRPGSTFIRMAISADARFAAAHVPGDKKLVVWDIGGAKPVEHLTRDMADAYTMTFSPDGRWLAVDDPDNDQPMPLLLCDLAKKEWTRFPHRPAHLAGFSFTPDGKWLTVPIHAAVVVIETATGKQQHRQELPGETVAAAATSPDGKTLAVLPSSSRVGKEPTMRFYSTENGSDVPGLTGPASHSRPIQFAPDGKSLVLAEGWKLREWEPTAGKWLRDVTVPTKYYHSEPVRSADGKRLATHNDCTLAILDAKTWKPLRPETLADVHTNRIHTIAVSPDGTVIATGSEVLGLWDGITGKRLASANVSAAAFLPGSKSFVALMRDVRGIAVFDARTAKELRRFAVADDQWKNLSFSDLRLSPDGKTLTTLAIPGAVNQPGLTIRWDVATGKATGQRETAGRRLRESFPSPDGKWQAWGGVVTPEDPADGDPLAVLPRDELGFYGWAWSPDSTLVAMAHAVGPRGKPKVETMVVFDVVKKVKVAELATGPWYRTAFTRDGRFVAGIGDSHVTVWEVATGRERFRAACDRATMILPDAIVFTSDGKRLITGHDTTALVWDVSGATK